MTRRYDDGAFIEREPSRRSLRDEYRDKFFAELGGERLKDPFDFDPEPDAQLGIVIGLIDTAKSIHMDDTSAIENAMALVGQSMLGIPALGLPLNKLERPTLGSVAVSRLSKRHFDRWVALDDDPGSEAE